MDLTKVGFWSGANYLKRLTTAEGSQAVSVGAFSTQTITVSHGLGHIPADWVVGLSQAGPIWVNNIPWAGMSGTTASPNLYRKVWTTTTDLTITVYNDTAGTLTGTVYWIVYLDYNV